MADTKKFAVILSGCGNKDGAEIHESVMTLWAIHKHGAEYQCFAPDIPQHHVLNFITGAEMNEKRNVLAESARIARGNIRDLKTYKAEEYNGLIMPGGLGTLDETFEILTWKQLGLHEKPVVIADIGGYWRHLVDLVEHMIAESYAKPENRALFQVIRP